MFIIRGFLSVMRFLFFFIVLMLLWRMIRALLFGHRSPPQPASPSGASQTPPAIGKTVRDPVCGTYVATELAIPGPSGGDPVYFCSEECKRNYRKIGA